MTKTKMRFKHFIVSKAQLSFLGLLLLVTLSLVASFSLRPQIVAAAGKVIQSGDATFEVSPIDGKIYAKLSYSLFNLDDETKYDAYYPKWNAVIPSSATNISVNDDQNKLNFEASPVDYWTILRINLGIHLTYAMNYSFTVNYTLPVTNVNQSQFTAWTPGGSWTTTVVVPNGYFDEVLLDPKPNRVYNGAFKTTYEYLSATSNQSWVLVKAYRKGMPVTQSASVSLSKKPVSVSVSLWEGEKQNVSRIIGLYSAALPLLETITGTPYPNDYSITLTEGSDKDLNGFAGQNGREKGITVLWSSKSDDDLLHELSHYWASRTYWAEAWMREGQAELYAYLTMSSMGNQQKAQEIIDDRTKDYNNGKNKIDLLLSQWTVPVSYLGHEDIVDYGYGKSFVFMYNLYQKIGDKGLRSANNLIFKQNTPATWLDYYDALEASTGQEMRPIFVDWVVPKTMDPILAKYHDTTSALSKINDRLGIEGVEQKLAESRASIVKFDSNAALNGLQLTVNTTEEWRAALQSYRETEAAIAKQTDTLGIQAVNDFLDQSRVLMVKGNNPQAKEIAQASLVRLQEWRGAL